jgi:anti-sigma regulatory factor (Ser/Thr protein kinase)
VVHVVVKKRRLQDEATEKYYDVHDALAFDASWPRPSAQSFFDKSVTLDLSTVTYLHHDAILYLAGIVRFRVNKRWDTKFVLPASEEVLHYLVAWKFPELMTAVTGLEFETMISGRDRKRLKLIIGGSGKLTRTIWTPFGGDQELLGVKYFAATPVARLDNPYAAASIAQKRYLEQHMLGVLDRYLGTGKGQRVGTRVVQEAVLNAASHPKAKLAYTSSQFIQPSPLAQGVPARLEICIWDDGVPIGDTLLNARRENLPITTLAHGALDEAFTVRLVRANGRAELKVVGPKDVAVLNGFAWLTVAAFLAGVTSKADRSKEPVRDQSDLYTADDPLPVGLRGQGGLGFYVIRRNVVDLFRGKIRYMCGNYRMSMTAGSKAGEYDVLLQYRPQRSWPLQGNLLILEIPIPAEQPPAEDEHAGDSHSRESEE